MAYETDEHFIDAMIDGFDRELDHLLGNNYLANALLQFAMKYRSNDSGNLPNQIFLSRSTTDDNWSSHPYPIWRPSDVSSIGETSTVKHTMVLRSMKKEN